MTPPVLMYVSVMLECLGIVFVFMLVFVRERVVLVLFHGGIR